VINAVIGSGIFGLPSAVANLVGAWSPLAVLIAGCSIFIVILCFAEVGSRFEDVGGPYLYAIYTRAKRLDQLWASRSAGFKSGHACYQVPRP
jgi:amino acid transporter